MNSTSRVVYAGVGGHVVALDLTDGSELWRTRLKASTFVTLIEVGDRIVAGAAGEAFCLDKVTGSILWHNKLKGLGMGVVAFGGDDAAVARAAVAAQTAATAATT
jgi:outer membrane protein assembly factor BamB